MRKLKLEKVTGVVALAYLVLIPVGAIYAWRRVQQMDNDMDAIWLKLEMEPRIRDSLFNLPKMKDRFFSDQTS